jgi:hypothetical protein
MKSFLFFAIAVLFAVQSAMAAGHVDVYIPNVNILPVETSCDLPITARLQSGDVYNLGGYVLKVNVAGDGGCTFSGPATQGSDNYLLGQSDFWDGGSLANSGRTLEQITDLCMQSPDCLGSA